LLREASRRFLPQSVIDHRKQGFAAPLAIWLRGEMRDFVDEALSAKQVAHAGVLDATQVGAIMLAHQERRRLNDKQIFTMLMLHLWLKMQS
jgi:asparagine synthase (glutamine-hydrolysing)